MEYNRGDIILANNESAVGNMQSGTRPYLIISNDKNNEFSNIITVIPATTKEKTPLPTHYTIQINGKDNTFLAEQITCISKDNIISNLGRLDKEDMRNIEKRIKVQLDLGEKPKIAGTIFDKRFALTPEQKEQVWNDYLSSNIDIRSLAWKYRVSKTLIQKIVNEKKFELKGTDRND